MFCSNVLRGRIHHSPCYCEASRSLSLAILLTEQLPRGTQCRVQSPGRVQAALGKRNASLTLRDTHGI